MSARLKLPVLILVACLRSYCTNAQEIKDGFIILSSGKYQYGYVQFDPALNVYEECRFASEGKSYTKYTPDQVLGYGVINGIHFATKEITTGATRSKHFLKIENDELIKLYSFNDNRFFVEKDSFEELTDGNYKAVLAEALKSCNKILPSIKKTRFNPGGIQGLLLAYRRCVDPESVTTSFRRFQFEVMAGGEFNNTTLHSGTAQLTPGDISLIDKTLFSGGVNAIFGFKKSKHLSGAIGVYYYQQNFYATNQSVASDHSSTNKVNLDYGELVFPLALQYSLFKLDKKVMPYVKMGISIPVTFKSTLVWENEQEYASTVYFERYNLPQEFKQSLQPTISAGTTFHLFNNIRNVFEVSYIQGKGELKNASQSLTVRSSRIVVLLGVRF